MGLIRLGVLVAFVAVYWLQSAIDQRLPSHGAGREFLYLPSGSVLKKLSLGHAGLLADIYWMRSVQYYGGKRLKNESNFDLLYPLLQITTTLDPKLLHAYRFGAIFLSEHSPIGANSPERAIELLRKGIANNPAEWQLFRDIGFVYFWYVQDYRKAAEAFMEGSRNPKSAVWMRTFAANLLAKGGNRQDARFLWQQVYENSENEQIRENAKAHLRQLSAEEDMEALQLLVDKVQDKMGRRLSSLDELRQLGFFPRVPLDPDGYTYVLNPENGKVELSVYSTIRR